MLDDNLIATLETSLRQTRNAQTRLGVRLREVEAEAQRLRQEIEALENSAAQTERAIDSLMATIRSGNQTWKLPAETSLSDDYEIPSDIKRPFLQQAPPPSNFGNTVSYIKSNTRGIPSIAPKPEPVSTRFSDRTITQACTLLLREHGRPLHVNELYNLLVAGGMPFTGNNPTISIAVSLNRNRRFKKVAPGTFDLVMRDASQATG